MPQNKGFFQRAIKKVHKTQATARKGIVHCLECIDQHPGYTISGTLAVVGLGVLAAAEHCNKENVCVEHGLAALRIFAGVLFAFAACACALAGPEVGEDNTSDDEANEDEEALRLSVQSPL